MSESSTPITNPPAKNDRRPAKQVSDPEVIAMHEIVEILDGLDEPARGRVVTWASERFKDDRPF